MIFHNYVKVYPGYILKLDAIFVFGNIIGYQIHKGYISDFWAGLLINYFLVGGIATPLKNMSSSIGMMIHNMWKNEKHVPNHQPDHIFIVIMSYMHGLYNMLI